MPANEEIQTFKKDFTPLLKLCRNFASGFRDEFLNKQNLEIVKKYAEDFSRKYRALQVVIERKEYDLPCPTLLLKDEKDFYNIFFIVEKLIPNIDRVIFAYGNKYHSVSTTEFKLRFSEFKPHLVNGTVYFNYAFESVKRKVMLRYRKEYGAIQIFDDDFMLDVNDPEFKLCMHYAFEKGYDENIDLSKYPDIFVGRSASEPQHFKGSLAGRGSY